MSKILKALSIETGLPEAEVLRIMLSAPVRYKDYTIPKRNGGIRHISQPAREVKLIQRAFVKTTLSQLPVHHAATAYKVGTSILDNARPHAGFGALLKLDFQDFFPSIRKIDWINYCRTNSLFDNSYDIEISASLLFRKPKGSSSRQLAIGAPSSPSLSNIIMHEFDELVAKSVEPENVVFTRYADDLTFTAPRTGYLVNVERKVREIMKGLLYPAQLTINNNKTTHVTTKYQRSVTGLILANDGRITLGKRRKRELHAAVHTASLGRLGDVEMQQLAGMLAFVHSVEPAFLLTLRDRYGEEIIVRIRKSKTVKRQNQADALI